MDRAHQCGDASRYTSAIVQRGSQTDKSAEILQHSRQPQSGSLEWRRMTVVRYERSRSSCFRLMKTLSVAACLCLCCLSLRLRQSAQSFQQIGSSGTRFITTNLLQRAVVFYKAQSINCFTSTVHLRLLELFFHTTLFTKNSRSTSSRIVSL